MATTNVEAPAYLVPGDLLKAEADYHSRIGIPAAKDTKTGQLVKYDVRGKYLVALTDEQYGQVMVQPHNCTINLNNVNQSDLDALSLTVDKLIKEGDAWGIKYVGTPYILPITPTAPTDGTTTPQ